MAVGRIVIFVASGNLEAQLSVSILVIVLTTVFPAVGLSVLIWVFWRASHRDAPPSTAARSRAEDNRGGRTALK